MTYFLNMFIGGAGGLLTVTLNLGDYGYVLGVLCGAAIIALPTLLESY